MTALSQFAHKSPKLSGSHQTEPVPRTQLDNLLTAEESLYQLTLLKHEPRDFSYQEIQKEVEKRALLADLYQLTTRFLPDLHISNENIKYYASLITYHPVREIKRMSREIAHAYSTVVFWPTIDDSSSRHDRLLLGK